MHELQLNSHYFGKNFFNSESTSKLPRYRWYHLKEGFSVELVDEAIKQNLPRSGRTLNILEPFSGTGTTPLTAALNKHNCTAIEVNPFLAFTAKVKVTTGQWRESTYQRRLEEIIQLSSNGSYSPLEDFSTFSEKDSLSKWLFNKSVLRRFTSLMEAINEYGGTYKNSFQLSAIVAVYDCCNARRDGKALRYKKNWQDLKYSDVDFIEKFRSHARMVFEDIQEKPIESGWKPEILIGDSRKKLPELKNNHFDLIVTSPPYLNSFDYSDIYRPELFLGNYINNNSELRKLRLKTLRSHVQVKWPEKISFDSILLRPIVQELEQSETLWDKRIPLMVHAYFDDIWNIFQQLKLKLKAGGEIWLVVSTSAYGGVHIPVDLIIADAATQTGLELSGIHCLRSLRTAGQQWKQFEQTAPPLRESLIILKK